MADYKTSYTTNVVATKKTAENNIGLSTHLNGGFARTSKYGSGWDSVDINEIVKKFVPGATVKQSRGKIIFSNGGKYEVIADVAGGYLRIQDVSKKFEYVDMNGNHKPSNISKSKWKQMTHYKIKKNGGK